MSSITVRVDADTKSKAEALFNSLGMTVSGAISVFLKQSIEEQALPFRPKRNQHKTLRQRMEEHYGKDFDAGLKENPYKFEEWDTGEPVGREVF